MGIENNAKKHLERKSNMKKKRILALAMVLCMSLMLAACGRYSHELGPRRNR